MHLLKSKAFARFAKGNGISDADLCDAIDRAERGLVDADLGGNVIKQRIARDGAGKSGGYRTVVLYKAAAKAVFVYGFEKSAKENITPKERKAFKDAAKLVLKLSDEQISAAIKKGAFIPVERPKSVLKK